jgi:hypothetical protein
VFTEFVIVIVPFPSVMLFPPVMIAVKLPSAKSKQEGALFEFKLIINSSGSIISNICDHEHPS